MTFLVFEVTRLLNTFVISDKSSNVLRAPNIKIKRLDYLSLDIRNEYKTDSQEMYWTNKKHIKIITIFMVLGNFIWK